MSGGPQDAPLAGVGGGAGAPDPPDPPDPPDRGESDTSARAPAGAPPDVRERAEITGERPTGQSGASDLPAGRDQVVSAELATLDGPDVDGRDEGFQGRRTVSGPVDTEVDSRLGDVVGAVDSGIQAGAGAVESGISAARSSPAGTAGSAVQSGAFRFGEEVTDRVVEPVAGPAAALAEGAASRMTFTNPMVSTSEEQLDAAAPDSGDPREIAADIRDGPETGGGEATERFLTGAGETLAFTPAFATEVGEAPVRATEFTAGEVADRGTVEGVQSAGEAGRAAGAGAVGAAATAARDDPARFSGALVGGLVGPAAAGASARAAGTLARRAGESARAAGTRARQAVPDRQELRAFVDDESAMAGGGMRPSRDPDAGPDGPVGTSEFPDQGREREVTVQRQREADSGGLLPDDFDSGELAPREAVALARDQFDRPDAAGRQAVEERAAALLLESRARQQNVPFDARQQLGAVEQARRQLFEGADIDLLPAQAQRQQQRQQQRQTAATAPPPAAGGVTAAVGAQLTRGQDQAVDQAVTPPASDGETVEATADPTPDQRVDELFAVPGTDGETAGVFDDAATQDITEDTIVPGVTGETVGVLDDVATQDITEDTIVPGVTGETVETFDQPQDEDRLLATATPGPDQQTIFDTPDNGGRLRIPRRDNDDNEFLPDIVLDEAAGAWATPVADADDVAASLFGQPRGETS